VYLSVLEEEELLMKAFPGITCWLIMAVVAALGFASVPVSAHEERERRVPLYGRFYEGACP
jgi:hypothetical protein